jgi:hypothetical protein
MLTTIQRTQVVLPDTTRADIANYLFGLLPSEGDKKLFSLLVDVEPVMRIDEAREDEIQILAPVKKPRGRARGDKHIVKRENRQPWMGEVVAALADDDRDAAQCILWDHRPTEQLAKFLAWHKPLLKKFQMLKPGKERMDFLKNEYGLVR